MSNSTSAAYATKNKSSLSYQEKIKVWNELREMLMYQQTLPNQENRTYIEFQTCELAKRLGIPPWAVSVILTQLGKEGYLKREKMGSRFNPGVFRLFTTESYEDAVVEPREDYYVPTRKRSQKVKVERAVVPATTLEEEIETDELMQEVTDEIKTIRAEVESILPKEPWEYAAPKVEVFQQVGLDLGIASLAEVLKAAQKYQAMQSHLTAVELEHQREMAQYERGLESLTNDLIIERAAVRKLENELRKQKSESEGYLLMADKATRSIRTAKTVVGEVTNTLGRLTPQQWAGKSEAKTVEVLLDMLGLESRDIDELFAKLQEIKQLDED